MGILVIGAVFVDIKGYPEDQFNPSGRNVGRVIQTHGGVSRNVAEDIANVELRPTLLSAVDSSGTSQDVIQRLKRHKVNTDYLIVTPDGLGTWLAIFDNSGDVVASISRRPNLIGLLDVLLEKGDALVGQADSVVVEIDIDVPVLKAVFSLAEKHGKAVYAVVSNMSIAMERRDLLQRLDCLVCNQQEAGLLFSENFDSCSPSEMEATLQQRIRKAGLRRMVVTMGEQGAVWAENGGLSGYCPPQRVEVLDTTGAGDSFFAGVAIGLTYGKSLPEACIIGTRLASSVLATKDSVCPRFRPEEFDLPAPKEVQE